ncbi:MAG: ATP-binding protein [Anaerolineales bacterium]|nr:ATP-binding protein [Anaerolineales bacterium]
MTTPAGRGQPAEEPSIDARRQITRAAQLESLPALREFVARACQARPGLDRPFIYDLALAVDEACTNIITHGYAGQDPGSIVLACRIEPGKVVLTITDFGRPFEPCEPPRPQIGPDPDQVPAGGLGLFFIYQSTDEVDYATGEDGNHLVLTKHIRPAAPPGPA